MVRAGRPRQYLADVLLLDVSRWLQGHWAGGGQTRTYRRHSAEPGPSRSPPPSTPPPDRIFMGNRRERLQTVLPAPAAAFLTAPGTALWPFSSSRASLGIGLGVAGIAKAHVADPPPPWPRRPLKDRMRACPRPCSPPRVYTPAIGILCPGSVPVSPPLPPFPAIVRIRVDRFQRLLVTGSAKHWSGSVHTGHILFEPCATFVHATICSARRVCAHLLCLFCLDGQWQAILVASNREPRRTTTTTTTPDLKREPARGQACRPYRARPPDPWPPHIPAQGTAYACGPVWDSPSSWWSRAHSG